MHRSKSLFKLAVLILLLAFTVGCGVDSLRQAIEKETPWVSSRVYAKGEYTFDDPQVYQSSYDGNQGHQPSASPVWWSPSP